ncbi:rust resistance kinase Lr10-like [Olea europaea var. sylvestris]|uniref:rust resistance kinase Lr10-like n=1 Tax=Olea europaea var. sylvestris TaxID=158386 RepID=UPI000C1D8122|nr:rust resistance kinase Lr10-like [Olea europaea var. sylvestris]
MNRFIVSFIFLVLHVISGFAVSQDHECQPTRCGDSGPTIKFPFRLRDHQPEHCGYPGFELSCTESNDTEFELQFPVTASTNNVMLPIFAKVWIWKIDYRAQLIYINDFMANYCPPGQPPSVNSSISLFKIAEVFGVEEGYTLFNCSSNLTASYPYPIKCLSRQKYQVLAIYSSYGISSLPQYSSCFKMYNVSYVPYSVFTGEHQKYSFHMSLHWSKPSCGNCEAKGKYCRLKNNGTESGMECFSSKQQGQGVSRKLIVAGIVVGVLLILFLIIGLYIVLSLKKRKKDHQKKIESFLEDYMALRTTRFSYADIKKITENFKKKLGQGGYGMVYKGKLSNQILVTVKVLKFFEGNGEEFINEVGTIGRIHHVNVVRLVGYCADGYRRALVYEFLPNDSLEKFITLGNQSRTLGWDKLQQIAMGIAKGLDYLHQGCNQRILHFDIKPHNILLDHNFNPKVSDFGLAKLCSKDQSIVSMTAARGTIGYIAPEVFSRNYGNVSYKADVYSFGMLLIDIVGGRKNFRAAEQDSSQVYFPEWMYSQLEKGEEIEIGIDKDEDSKIFKKLTIAGLWCIQWNPADRPSMKMVIQMLEGENVPIMPPNPFASMKSTN